MALRGAPEQQVREVRAGDQEHQHDGAEQQPERALVVADDLLAQRYDSGGCVLALFFG